MSERQRQVSGLTRKLVAEGIIEEASALKIDQEAKSANLPFVTYLNEKGISTERIATAEADECTTHILDLDAIKLGSSDPHLEPFIMAFLGVVVGGMMVAIFHPIFQMGGAISG